MSKRTKILLIAASIAVVVFLAIGVYVLSSFRVVKLPAGSMANTIVPGESVLCLLSNSEVNRGEIILFKLPSDPKVTYLKRVIGLPDDR
jgi:signal peptidase I